MEAVAFLDELAQELPDGRVYIRDQLRRAANSVFGQIKQGMGFRRFSMRGMDSAKGEWALFCTCHNVRKLWAARRADRLGLIA